MNKTSTEEEVLIIKKEKSGPGDITEAFKQP